MFSHFCLSEFTSLHPFILLSQPIYRRANFSYINNWCIIYSLGYTPVYFFMAFYQSQSHAPYHLDRHYFPNTIHSFQSTASWSKHLTLDRPLHDEYTFHWHFALLTQDPTKAFISLSFMVYPPLVFNHCFMCQIHYWHEKTGHPITSRT